MPTARPAARPRRVAVLLAAAAILTAAPAGAQTVAVVGGDNSFGYFNLSSRAYTRISGGIAGASDVRNIAYNGATRTLYVTDRTAGGTVLRILSPTGTASSSLGTIAVNGQADEISGAAFSPAGTLYGVDYNQERLVTISPANAATQVVGAVGYSTATPILGKLAFVGGNLYGTVASDPAATANGLYRYSTTSGAATFLGNGGQGSAYTDMLTFSNGSALYGISGTTLYAINTANGTLGAGQAITGSNLPASFSAAVIAPVPEPATVLGAAAGGLYLLRRVRGRWAAGDCRVNS